VGQVHPDTTPEAGIIILRPLTLLQDQLSKLILHKNQIIKVNQMITTEQMKMKFLLMESADLAIQILEMARV